MCPRRKTIPLFKIVKHAFERISKLSLENGKAYLSTSTNDLLFTVIWEVPNHFLQLGCKICKIYVCNWLFGISTKKIMLKTDNEITNS